MTFAAMVFAPFTVFVSQPLLALIPAALFAALYRASRRRPMSYPRSYAAPRARRRCNAHGNPRTDMAHLVSLG